MTDMHGTGAHRVLVVAPGAPGPPPVGGRGAVRASVHDDITNIAAIGAPNLHLLDRTTAELDDARNTGIGSLQYIREITALGVRIQDGGEVMVRVTTQAGSRMAYRIDRWE